MLKTPSVIFDLLLTVLSVTILVISILLFLGIPSIFIKLVMSLSMILTCIVLYALFVLAFSLKRLTVYKKHKTYETDRGVA